MLLVLAAFLLLRGSGSQIANFRYLMVLTGLVGWFLVETGGR